MVYTYLSFSSIYTKLFLFFQSNQTQLFHIIFLDGTNEMKDKLKKKYNEQEKTNNKKYYLYYIFNRYIIYTIVLYIAIMLCYYIYIYRKLKSVR